MTTFEKCKILRSVILNSTAEVMNYTNWSDNFCVQHLRSIPRLPFLQGADFTKVDPTDLTESEMLDLGFRKFSKTDDTYTIPLWLFPFLIDIFFAVCIDGKSKIWNKSQINLDHRGGCITYGVYPKQDNN